jgi:hypothetical protein
MPERLTPPPSTGWANRISEGMRPLSSTEPLPWESVRDVIESVLALARDELNWWVNEHLRLQALQERHPPAAPDAFSVAEPPRQTGITLLNTHVRQLQGLLWERTVTQRDRFGRRTVGICHPLSQLGDLLDHRIQQGTRVQRAIRREGDLSSVQTDFRNYALQGDHYRNTQRERIVTLRRQVEFLEWLLITHYATNPNTPLNTIDLPQRAETVEEPEELVGRTRSARTNFATAGYAGGVLVDGGYTFSPTTAANWEPSSSSAQIPRTVHVDGRNYIYVGGDSGAEADGSRAAAQGGDDPHANLAAEQSPGSGIHPSLGAVDDRRLGRNPVANPVGSDSGPFTVDTPNEPLRPAGAPSVSRELLQQLQDAVVTLTRPGRGRIGEVE